MTTTSEQDTQAIEAVNTRFYEALSALDIEAMDLVWSHEDGARCIHPGWEVIEGWEVIRESWSVIFRNSRRLQVAPSEVQVRVEGEMAWVCCLETIKSGPGSDDTDETLARATNLFVRTPDGWRMILHHASQIPPESREDDEDDEPTVH